jgi:enoyl-CoA hydratase/carnithine racemase
VGDGGARLSVEPADFEELDYTVADGVALITLNRPERHNTWGGTMSVEYRWALHHAHVDPAVRVVVLTAAGATFCAGADRATLDEIGRADGRYARAASPLPPYPQDAPAGLRHNHTAPLCTSTPIIAAINGACAGVGFVVAAYADIRWASDRARFATSFAGLGLPAEYGLGWMLPRIVGTGAALDLLYDPRPRPADELLRCGFVQRVVAHDELLPTVLAYARALARHSSADSLRWMKRAVLLDAAGDAGAAYAVSVAQMDEALTGDDFRIGVRAARARQRPDFLADRPEP